MIQISHINQRQSSLGGRSHVENMNPQHLPSHKQAGENDKVREMTQTHDQSSKLDPPKFQETTLCFVSRVGLTQEVKQRDPQEMSTDCKQFMPNTPINKRAPQEGLPFHRHYLRKRMEESQYTASRSELFKEIQAKGYRGSLKSVGNFLSTLRHNQYFPKVDEAVLSFHKHYLEERIRDVRYAVSSPQLFKEIQAKGYRGSIKTVQRFLAMIHQSKCPTNATLLCHRDYLSQRMKETGHRASGPQLFKEIQARGYQGSLKTVRNFLSIIRQNERSPEGGVAFHQDYLMKRMKETESRVSGSELFKEIRAKGYLGSLRTMRNFLSTIRHKHLPEESLAFHHDYLVKRMEETGHLASGPQLFKEIRDKGYRGSVSTVRNFLSMIRKNPRPPEACLTFHQDYLAEKLQGEDQTRRNSTLQLFKDIQTRGYRGSIDCVRKKLAMMRRETALKTIRTEGYRGSIKAVQNFLTTTHRANHPPETYLSFHKGDLISKIKEMPSRQITAAQLFRDIRAKGYRGSIRTVQQFVAVIRRNNHSSGKRAKPG